MSIDEKLTESPQIYFELEERITVKGSAFFVAVEAQVLSTSNMWNSNNSREKVGNPKESNHLVMFAEISWVIATPL